MNPFNLTDEQIYKMQEELNEERNTQLINLGLLNYRTDLLEPQEAEQEEDIDLDEVITNADRILHNKQFYDEGWGTTDETFEQAFFREQQQEERLQNQLFKSLGLTPETLELDEEQRELKNILNYIDAFGKRHNLSQAEILNLRSKATESFLKNKFNPSFIAQQKPINQMQQEINKKFDGASDQPPAQPPTQQPAPQPPAQGGAGESKEGAGTAQMIDTSGGIHTVDKPTTEAPAPAPAPRRPEPVADTGAGAVVPSQEELRANRLKLLQRVQEKAEEVRQENKDKEYQDLADMIAQQFLGAVTASKITGIAKTKMMNTINKLIERARNTLDITQSDDKAITAKDLDIVTQRSTSKTAEIFEQVLNNIPQYDALPLEDKVIVISKIDFNKVQEQIKKARADIKYNTLTEAQRNQVYYSYLAIIKELGTIPLKNMIDATKGSPTKIGADLYKAKGKESPKYMEYLYDLLEKYIPNLGDEKKTPEQKARDKIQMGYYGKQILELVKVNAEKIPREEDEKGKPQKYFKRVIKILANPESGIYTQAPAPRRPEPADEPAVPAAAAGDEIRELTEAENAKLNQLIDTLKARVMGSGNEDSIIASYIDSLFIAPTDEIKDAIKSINSTVAEMKDIIKRKAYFISPDINKTYDSVSQANKEGKIRNIVKAYAGTIEGGAGAGEAQGRRTQAKTRKGRILRGRGK